MLNSHVIHSSLGVPKTRSGFYSLTIIKCKVQRSVAKKTNLRLIDILPNLPNCLAINSHIGIRLGWIFQLSVQYQGDNAPSSLCRRCSIHFRESNKTEPLCPQLPNLSNVKFLCFNFYAIQFFSQPEISEMRTAILSGDGFVSLCARSDFFQINFRSLGNF